MPSANGKRTSYWQEFGPLSMPAKHLNSAGVIYYSWLEEGVKFHDPTAFVTLSHVTSLESTEKILQQGFKMQVIDDYSCVSRSRDNYGVAHPLQNVAVFWLGGGVHETASAIRYGNVRFSTKNLQFLKTMKFYFLEFLDYVSKTACRVIVSKRNYDDILLRFDPFDKEQKGNLPCCFQDGEWVQYKSFSNSRESERLLDVEFLLDDLPNQNLFYCAYVKCFDPRPMLTSCGKIRGKVTVYNGNLDVLKLINLLVRYQGCHRFIFYGPECLDHIIASLQIIDCTDEYLTLDDVDLSFMLTDDLTKVDYLISNINFAKAFHEKHIQKEHTQYIQMLDLLFHEAGFIPNGSTMLNVIAGSTDSMKSETTFADVISVFLKYFLSRSAKLKVKQRLINLLCSI